MPTKSIDLVQEVSPHINVIGSAYYFTPETLRVGKELGLDGFRFYFLGRGGVLGDVEAPVVESAFGYFAPQLVSRIWDSGRQRVGPRDAARAHLGCAEQYGRSHFSRCQGLDAFCAAAEAIVAATDPAGLALYAGVAAEPLPEDTAGRAMRLAVTLREHRGSAHLLAIVANGLSAKLAHRIRRPNDVGLFGWDTDERIQVTEEDLARLAAADELTDQLLARSFDALDPDARAAFSDGVHQMSSALSGGD